MGDGPDSVANGPLLTEAEAAKKMDAAGLEDDSDSDDDGTGSVATTMTSATAHSKVRGCTLKSWTGKAACTAPSVVFPALAARFVWHKAVNVIPPCR